MQKSGNVRDTVSGLATSHYQVVGDSSLTFVRRRPAQRFVAAAKVMRVCIENNIHLLASCGAALPRSEAFQAILEYFDNVATQCRAKAGDGSRRVPVMPLFHADPEATDLVGRLKSGDCTAWRLMNDNTIIARVCYVLARLESDATLWHPSHPIQTSNDPKAIDRFFVVRHFMRDFFLAGATMNDEAIKSATERVVNRMMAVGVPGDDRKSASAAATKYYSCCMAKAKSILRRLRLQVDHPDAEIVGELEPDQNALNICHGDPSSDKEPDRSHERNIQPVPVIGKICGEPAVAQTHGKFDRRRVTPVMRFDVPAAPAAAPHSQAPTPFAHPLRQRQLQPSTQQNINHAQAGQRTQPPSREQPAASDSSPYRYSTWSAEHDWLMAIFLRD